MKILSLSDVVLDSIYTTQARKKFPDADVIIGCGDLPYYYLEFVMTVLDVPLFFVRGNHAHKVEYSVSGPRTAPQGATDLHRRTCIYKGVLLAGVEGSLRYRAGPYQYSRSEMWGHVFSLVPGLLRNKVRYGRYLDVFVTHASPHGIHDQDDPPHHGVPAFNWLIQVFEPRLHLHGHIHVYQPWTTTSTQVGKTLVLNSYGYRETELDVSPPGS